MKIKLSFLISTFLIISIAAFGQAKGSTTPAPNTSTGPASTSDIGKYANWDQLSKQTRSVGDGGGMGGGGVLRLRSSATADSLRSG